MSSPASDCSTWCSRSAMAPSRLSSSARTTRSTPASRVPRVCSSSSIRPSSWPSVPSWRVSSPSRSVTRRSSPSSLRSTSAKVSRWARCSASWATTARLNSSSTRGIPSATSGFSGLVIGRSVSACRGSVARRAGSGYGRHRPTSALSVRRWGRSRPLPGVSGQPASSGAWSGPMPAEDVVVVGNTGDDEVFHGLHVSPDLDTVTYTLAGAVGPAGLGPRRRHLPHPGGLRPLRRADLVPPRRRRPRHPPLPHQPAPGGRHADRGDGRDRPGLGREGQAPPDDRRPGGDRDRRRGPEGEAPVTMAMQEWFVRERAQPPVAAVRFEGAAAGEARAGGARRPGRSRRRPPVPVQPGDLDRARSWRCPGCATSCGPAGPGWWA